jgi:hypothetical protein
MPRPLQRVRLESGLRLNLNSLVRRGFRLDGRLHRPTNCFWLYHCGHEWRTERMASHGFDPDEWELPPKPKWMRWRTYHRIVEKFDRYETMLEEGLLEAIMRLGLPLG